MTLGCLEVTFVAESYRPVPSVGKLTVTFPIKYIIVSILQGNAIDLSPQPSFSQEALSYYSLHAHDWVFNFVHSKAKSERSCPTLSKRQSLESDIARLASSS